MPSKLDTPQNGNANVAEVGADTKALRLIRAALSVGGTFPFDTMTHQELSVGIKVHYSPAFGPTENGMVKGWTDTRAWVVYKCDSQWHRFEDFTGCPTMLEDLRPGWRDQL